MKKTVTILIPCLNEESTLKKCIKGIIKVMNKSYYHYNILLCDNKSEDKSISIAKKERIDIVIEPKKGYGSTLLNGIKSIHSDYAVMLDADLSYNEKDIPKMLALLDDGYDLVVGKRIKEKHHKKGSTFIRRAGAKLLTWYGNILFHTKIKDFHCGLRAFKVKPIQDLNLKTTGMEFASEIIIESSLNKLKMISVDTYFKKEQRTTKAHLKPFKDGLRHLKYITKTKLKHSKPFLFFTIFTTTITLLIILLFLALCLPNEIPKQKAKEEIVNLHNYYIKEEIKTTPGPNTIDSKADINTLSIIYYQDSNKPLNSLIEMNHTQKVKSLRRTPQFIDSLPIENYSRYWHGQILILKPLLYIFNLTSIKIIFAIILGILITRLIYLLWKKNKILSISTLLSFISINIFVTPKCIEYIFVFIIMIITSILVIKNLEQEAKIDIILALSGLLTCFFDFLTVETLTLTIPLLLYSILKQLKSHPISIKKIIRWTIIWFGFYSSTFLLKWLISTIYYRGLFMDNIGNQLLLRTILKKDTLIIFQDLLISFKYIFPFYFFPDYLNYFLWFIIALTIVIHVRKKRSNSHLIYLFICLIPLLRFLILQNHFHYHYYFTYRALLPITIIVNYILINIIKKIKKSIK